MKWVKKSEKILFFLLGGVSLVVFKTVVLAQNVIPDATLGDENSIVTPIDAQNDRIDGGAIRGNNQFHSFDRFDIPEERGVYFSNPTGVDNIFTRVTGGNSSNLFGTLGVLGDANFYFINPQGVIFGPNFEFDVNGSVVISTAKRFIFPNEGFFSAINPELPPLLNINVDVPIGLQLGENGAIITAADLEAGKNLTLVGNTVVTTGNLSTPQGSVSVAGVNDNSAVVQLDETGKIVEILPSSHDSNSNSSTTSLSELVEAGGKEVGLIVNNSGEVELTNTETVVNVGDVILAGNFSIVSLEAEEVNLFATNNLILLDTIIETYSNLNLFAENSVQIRDSINSPFIAAAGGNLLIQGDEIVDIFALNHPNSGLISGGNLTLRSGNPVIGDARYWSYGDFQIEELDGNLGSLFSPNDPIIRSLGNVNFSSYTGASLHIIAGGSVNINSITVNSGIEGGTEGVDFIQETITLSNGRTLDIDGSAQATVDIRAGVNPEEIGIPGFTGVDLVDVINPSPDLNLPATSADINIGNIVISESDGQVLITNQYEANNSLPGGDINIGNIDENGDDVNMGGNGIAVQSFDGNGSDVTIDSRGDFNLKGDIQTDSLGIGEGNAGDVLILAAGNVTLDGTEITANIGSQAIGDVGTIEIFANSVSFSNNAQLEAGFFSGGQGNGGLIFIEATDSVSISGSGLFGDTISGSIGNTSHIEIRGNSISITDGSLLVTDNEGVGNAGDILIQATGLVRFENSSIGANIGSGSGAFAIGNVGNITIEGSSVSLINPDIQAGIFGGAEAITSGTVSIEATDLVEIQGPPEIVDNNLDNGIFVNVAPEGVGDSGDISIITPNLSIRDNIALNAQSAGNGNGGEISIDTNSFTLDNSSIFSNILSTGVGNGGQITINSDFINFINGSQLVGTTSGNGNAANIDITATESIILNDGSTIFAQVNDNFEAFGNGGTINITAGSLEIMGVLEITDFPEITPSAALVAGTAGFGDAGSINITVTDNFILDTGGISTEVLSGGFGNGGDININASTVTILNNSNIQAGVGENAQGNGGEINISANNLSLENNAQISNSTEGMGNAGNVIITVAEGISLNNSNILSAVGGNIINSEGILIEAPIGIGNAGSIEITANTLLLTNISFISATVLGEGNGGDLTILVNDLISLDNFSSISSSIGSEGIGNGGDLTILANSLSLKNVSIIGLTTSGIGNAGNAIIDVTETISLNNLSFIDSTVDPDAIGNGGEINLTANSLLLTNNSSISSTTSGDGDAGDVIISATDNIEILGNSFILTTTLSEIEGDGGTIDIDTNLLSLTGSQIDSTTFGVGEGGTITITANTITANETSSIQTSTTDTGNAGDITLNISDTLILDNSGIFADTIFGTIEDLVFESTGDGGIIIINSIENPIDITLTNQSGIAVDSKGEGIGGDIFINDADNINLDNESAISAVTQSTEGGNITIVTENLLEIRNESQISATAGLAEDNGNGGNITIDVNFILASPLENTDITANAFLGDGGNIDITTEALFGLEVRDFQTELSDITVTSAFGFSGTIDLDTSGIDPIRGIENLPDVRLDTDIVIGCQAAGQGESEFFLPGNGGLPALPDEPLDVDIFMDDWTPLKKPNQEDFINNFLHNNQFHGQKVNYNDDVISIYQNGVRLTPSCHAK